MVWPQAAHPLQAHQGVKADAALPVDTDPVATFANIGRHLSANQVA
jgi:hypothetical protein